MLKRRTLLGFAVSAVFLFFALRGQDFEAVWDAFRAVNYWYLLPAVAVYFVGLFVKSVRWRILLKPIALVPVRTVFSINTVGTMANNVLPLRTGEVVRAYALSKKAPVTKSAALGTIAVERIFDGMTMLLFIAGSMVFVSLTSDIRNVAILAFGLFSAAFAGVILLAHGGQLRTRFLRLVLGPLPDSISDRADRVANSFFDGLGVFRNRKELILVSVTSVLAWSIEASAYWFVAQAFGGSIAEVMGIPEVMLTTGIANLSTLVPSSPGYVGPFEAAIILVLNGALDLSRELALSYAILLHALLLLPVTIVGAIEWSRMHLSMSRVEAGDGAREASVVRAEV